MLASTSALGWGSVADAAAILHVDDMTVRRAAAADEITHRWVRGRLLIWLPDIAAPKPKADKPIDPSKPRRGRPKNSDRRK